MKTFLTLWREAALIFLACSFGSGCLLSRTILGFVTRAGWSGAWRGLGQKRGPRHVLRLPAGSCGLASFLAGPSFFRPATRSARTRAPRGRRVRNIAPARFRSGKTLSLLCLAIFFIL